jgi:Rrf2 family nitric oxide-sensitive transcriptional repressor
MLSQTTEYALRAMSYLAYITDGLTSTSELAEYTHVPSNYLAKVLQLLAKADLVNGRRGVGGGYKLARSSDSISLLDVINAIDPIRPITSCPLGLENHSGSLCPLHKKLDEASRTMIKVFSDISLKDIISEVGESRPLCNTEMTKKVELTFDKTKG